MKKIKIFYDGVDLDFIKKNKDSLDGVTTNPTLMNSYGIKSYIDFSRELIDIVPEKPVSLEIFADEHEEMKTQALKISSWGENIYVKIPITNSLGESTKQLIQDLIEQNVKLNITAIFTLNQVEEISDVFKNSENNILSIFCGRIADAGENPIKIINDTKKYIDSQGLKIDLLWASAREAYNIIEATESGCDIITLNENLINKMGLFGKDLTAFSLETVKMFKSDAESAGYKI